MMIKAVPAGATPSSTKHYLTLACAMTIAVTIVMLIALPWQLPQLLTTLSNQAPGSLGGTERVHTTNSCAFPVVYNKPPKTASSFLQTVIQKWSVEQKRPSYLCYETPVLTSMLLPDCLPEDPQSCAVFSAHIFMNAPMREIMSRKLPNFKYITSTRFPAHRIISFFLFTRNLLPSDPNWQEKLPYYLQNYNPWRLYNYHTGEKREGSCPLTELEKRYAWQLASSYDIVLDVNAVDHSNAILKHHKLFSIPTLSATSSEREKNRGTTEVKLRPDMLKLLRTKTCVEDEMHRAFHIRMASLYEKATGIKCVFPRYLKDMQTCTMQAEAAVLNGTWAYHPGYGGGVY